MYRSIGYPIPDYEENESEGRGSDEPIDVDTIDTEENSVPQTTKRELKQGICFKNQKGSPVTDALSCHCFYFKNKALERKNNYVLLPFLKIRDVKSACN